MKLEKSKFVRWLKEKPAAEIVGKNRDCHACPIANFYCEATGGCEIVIGDSGDGYKINRGDGDRPLPFWAYRFVSSVDGEHTREISAGRALEILAL